MISCDTNILFYYYNKDCPEHIQAKQFLEQQTCSREFALCELVLMELYVLLRHPKLSNSSLSAHKATQCIQDLRSNPYWSIIDYPGNLMEQIWPLT